MPGTRAGGKKFSAKMKAKYGPNYFHDLASRGGKASNTGGFAGDPERARAMGKLGGRPAQLIKQAKRDKLSRARREQALRWMAEGKRMIDPITHRLVPVAKAADDLQVGNLDPPKDHRQADNHDIKQDGQGE